MSKTKQTNGITFIDVSEDVKKTMSDLAKTALRKSGNVIKKYLRQDLPVRTSKFKNHVGSWPHIDYKTGQPKLQVGFYGWQKVKKRGKQPSHASPWWIERGTKPHTILTTDKVMYDKSTGTSYGHSVDHPGQQATNLLRNTVYNHISEIREAQEKYLKLLNDEIDKAKGFIDESDEEDDD